MDGNPEDRVGEDIPEIIPDEGNEKVVEVSQEYLRLGSKKALPTVLSLSAGPLVSQITTALYGIVDTMWISAAIGDRGMAAVSTFNNFDTISRIFGNFLFVSASSMISSLFGSGKGEDAGRLYVDLIKVAFICAAIVPLIFIPLTRPIGRWFGATEEIIELGRSYVNPLLGSAIIPCLYLLSCGCLQSEGRSWTFAIMQITSCFLNMLLFDPLFLFGFKMGIKGAAWATVMAELCPTIVVMYMYFSGKLGIKPKFSYFLAPFSENTMKAVKIGMSQLMYLLSMIIPGIIMRKFLSMTCETDEIYTNVMAGFNTMLRVYLILNTVLLSMVQAFIPSAGFAFGAKRYRRVLFLLSHCLWISVSWILFCMIFTVGFPRWCSAIFSKSPKYLDWSEVILRNSTLMSFLSPVINLTQALLQALQLGGRATVMSLITHMAQLPILAAILYYTGPNNPSRMFYAYSIQVFTGSLIAIPFGLKKLLSIIDSAKTDLNDRGSDEDIIEEL